MLSANEKKEKFASNDNRQYLLIQTDILQKTVVGCPCLTTHKNGDFGVISVRERSFVAPISKWSGYVLCHT